MVYFVKLWQEMFVNTDNILECVCLLQNQDGGPSMFTQLHAHRPQHATWFACIHSGKYNVKLSCRTMSCHNLTLSKCYRFLLVGHRSTLNKLLIVAGI